MLKYKVEEHVLKSTTLKLNADSSSPELKNMARNIIIGHEAVAPFTK